MVLLSLQNWLLYQVTTTGRKTLKELYEGGNNTEVHAIRRDICTSHFTLKKIGWKKRSSSKLSKVA
jgi:hypothetical protein